MSIINEIKDWIDTVIFGNKTKTSIVQEEDAPAVAKITTTDPVYEEKRKSSRGKPKKETSPNKGTTKKPKAKKSTGAKKSSKSVKKKTTSNS